MIVSKNNLSIDLFNNTSKVFDSPDNNRSRIDNLKFALSQISIQGDVLEFGVYTASTINLISSVLNQDKVYGFDSFEGLPEEWKISTDSNLNKYKKGYFALKELPKVNDNVVLVKGFYDQSVEPWIEETNLSQVKFLHVDSDLYSSAIFILTTLNKYLVPGTVIVFDEMHPWGGKRYDMWADHEYRALKEWVETFDREFEIVSRSAHQQCTIKMLK